MVQDLVPGSILVLLVALGLPGCAAVKSTNPTAPTAAAKRMEDLQYAINVPNPQLTNALRVQYGPSVALAPVVAQQQFDYRAQYDGTPNVYGGDGSYQPQNPTIYRGAAILYAPLDIASKPTFGACEWSVSSTAAPCDPDLTYRWVGVFAYAVPVIR